MGLLYLSALFPLVTLKHNLRLVYNFTARYVLHTYFPHTKSFHVGFGVDEMSIGEVFLQEPLFLPCQHHSTNAHALSRPLISVIT
jgi:hypothetical protein